MVFSAVLIILLGVFSLGYAVAPRRMWWATVAWRYKHPEVHEPSDARYAWGRAGGLVAGVLCVGFGVAIVAGPPLLDARQAEREEAHDEWQQECRKIMEKLERAASEGGRSALAAEAADLGVQLKQGTGRVGDPASAEGASFTVIDVHLDGEELGSFNNQFGTFPSTGFDCRPFGP